MIMSTVMKKITYSLFLLVLIFFPRSAMSQQDFAVTDISLSGNRAFSDKDLFKQTETKRVDWFSEHILQQEPFLFNSEILETDIQRIKTFYQREGYLFVEVPQPEMKIDQKSRSVALTFRVRENTPVIVKEVTFSLPGGQSGRPHDIDSLLTRAQSDLLLKSKTVFRDAHVTADRKTLLTILANSGYPFATVDHRLFVEMRDTTASVNWMIIPGPSAVFGDVTITGNDRVPVDLVQGKLTFRQGTSYNAAKLIESQTAVYNLGLFNAVTIRADLDDTTSTIVPVTVTLKEATQIKLFLGAGYGKEEQFRVTAELRLLDVVADADKLNLELKHSALQPYEIKLTYLQPDFLFNNMTLSVIPTVRSETETAYSMTRFGSRISLDYPLFRQVHGSIGYGIEKVELDTASIASTNPADQVLEKYMKHSVIINLLHTNAVPLFDPIRGMIASLKFMLSGVTESDPYRFNRALLDLKRYDQLRESTVLASRLAIGTIHSLDAGGFIPVEERFFAGGSNSNRGWARFQLGPKDPSGKPVGGSSIIDGSVEIRQRISGPFSCTLFTDYAEIQEQPLMYTFADLHFAAGIGLRYKTAIGPIRFDIAKPVFEGDLPVQFILSIGHAY
jgi:outer membrane protein insertion porin family